MVDSRTNKMNSERRERYAINMTTEKGFCAITGILIVLDFIRLEGAPL